MTSGARYQRVATSVMSGARRIKLTFGETILLWIGMLEGFGGTSETKIANLQVAIGIEQEVGRFEVSVND